MQTKVKIYSFQLFFFESSLKFYSTPSKVIIGIQKAWKYKNAAVYRANDRNL